ncbi:MAG: C-type lectin domain-containing protein [Verrucomicrobiota bacterium]
MKVFPWLLMALPVALILDSAEAAELPRISQELVEKLEEFEKAEKEKLEKLIAEKRNAVVQLLKQQAIDEARKGNAEGSIAIREKIVDLGGEPSAEAMATSQPSAGWEVPDDAILYRGDYYKVYSLAESITWEEARERCRAVGGEIGWLDRDEDDAKLREWMQPVVDERGHAPIWMGARKNDAGEWFWVNGKSVAKDFWRSDSHATSSPNEDAMIRWIGGLDAASPETGRKMIGYLCRWKR